MPKDLVVLTACSNAKFAVQGVIESPHRLAIRSVTVDYFVHPNKDPGCLNQSESILRSQQRRYERALVVFDREGCGQDHLSRDDLESHVEGQLERQGWQGRAAAIAVDPELEAWVWSDSSEVDHVLGWHGRIPSLRSWLVEEGLLKTGHIKPLRPKEAVEAALEFVRMRRTSAIYRQLATRVSFRRCIDPAFKKLCSLLCTWFSKD
jgi:hypothetical protein